MTSRVLLLMYKSNHLYRIVEYGRIKNVDDNWPRKNNRPDEIYIPDKAFKQLTAFIEENSSIRESDIDKAFRISGKNKRKIISVKDYVGVVETKSGAAIEILPKVYVNNSERQLNESKKAMLNMLRHLKSSRSLPFDYAGISHKKDFPILEIFIESFINEFSEIIRKSLKSDYVEELDNLNFLRGKILINENIKRNLIDRSRIYCQYEMFSIDNCYNRIIKNTLHKLLRETNSFNNASRISNYLNLLEEVNVSENIHADLRKAKSIGREHKYYSKILAWSEIYLLNKSFTAFSGENINRSFLIHTWSLFQDYIEYCIRKYLHGYRKKFQDNRYFLVDNHKDSKRFNLKPDVVADNKHSLFVIDAKWKLINASKSNRKSNYNIQVKDMYQLYAYGKKYELMEKKYNPDDYRTPKLLMICPKNENFKVKLAPFQYEGDLNLQVIPFDVLGNESKQIFNLFDNQ
jgi:5-methylcytosine-specific restriction enzyme subunit McrC